MPIMSQEKINGPYGPFMRLRCVGGAKMSDEQIDRRTIVLASSLQGRAARLVKWLSFSPRPPSHLMHEEMRLIYEAFSDLSERFGMEKGGNCTECEEGFYSAEHCTYCGHEQYQ